MINWWVYIPMAIFLAFSAATWLIVKHADTEPGASSMNGTSPHAAGALDIEDQPVRQREEVGAR